MKIYSLVFAIRSTSTIMLHVIEAKSFIEAELDARKAFQMQGVPGTLELLVSNEFMVPEQGALEVPKALEPMIMIHREEVRTEMSEKNQVMQTIIKFKDAELFRIKRHMFDENEQNYLSAKIKTK